MSLGQHAAGLAGLEDALGCKYVASEALSALNAAYVLLHEAGGGADPGPMVVGGARAARRALRAVRMPRRRAPERPLRLLSARRT